MAVIVLRSVKGSPLTIAEADANFSNLNTEVGTKLDATNYNAADILTKIKTVDGSTSGLDADLLDGLNASNSHVDSTATIVARDSSGNFSANTITSNLVGNVTGNITGNLTGTVNGNATNVSGVVAVNNGGTGATTVGAARTALGLGTIATQNSTAVNITGGSIVNITDLAIADGGTGASTATQARTNLGLTIGADIQPFSNELTGIAAAVGTVGFYVRLGTGSVTQRTITAGSGASILNGDGVLGNPVINLSSQLVALSSLNTNGVIARSSSGIQTVEPGSSGNVLTSNGTTWTSAIPTPPVVKGLGLGGEVWQNVARALGVTYTNTRGYPIMISVNGGASGSSGISIVINGVGVYFHQAQWNGPGAFPGAVIIVPDGATYRVTMSTSGLSTWWELF
jgi:hypothetical protein